MKIRAARWKNTEDLHFIISDTGIGIQADRLETIFERFTQADDSTARRYSGTGLETTISRHLAVRAGREE